MLQRLAIRAGLAVLGIAFTLSWWTIRDRFFRTSADPSVKEGTIPAKIFGGGGGVVDVETDATHDAVVAVVFETNVSVDDSAHKFIETWQRVPAGEHTFSIDVPANIRGSIEVRLENPPVGASARARLRVGGALVTEDFQRLDEPLCADCGFSAYIAVEDFVTGKIDT